MKEISSPPKTFLCFLCLFVANFFGALVALSAFGALFRGC